MIRKNKFNAVGCRRGGIWYGSRTEAEYADLLELEKRAGLIKDFVAHPPGVALVGNTRWNIDFMVIDNDGAERYVEVKGMKTEGYRIKLQLYKDRKKMLKLPPLMVVARYGCMKFRAIEQVA